MGKDVFPKRITEDELDNLRSGVWANVGQDEEAPAAGGATSSGTKRPADEPADDRDRVDHANGHDTVGSGDENMIGTVEPFTCSHCSAKFKGQNIIIKQLYQHHGNDNQGAEKKLAKSTDLSQFPTSRLMK